MKAVSAMTLPYSLGDIQRIAMGLNSRYLIYISGVGTIGKPEIYELFMI